MRAVVAILSSGGRAVDNVTRGGGGRCKVLLLLQSLVVHSVEFHGIPTEFGKKAPAGTECDRNAHRNAL
jgi:hypothetical protein